MLNWLSNWKIHLLNSKSQTIWIEDTYERSKHFVKSANQDNPISEKCGAQTKISNNTNN